MNLISERQYRLIKRLAQDAELCRLPLDLVIRTCESNGWNYLPTRAALLALAQSRV